jgi:ribosome-binding ATPase
VKVGITGFPGSGKSTIFQSLAPGAPQSKGRAPVLGNIKIPDERIDFLTGVFQPKKTTFAEITFVDVPGGGDPKAGALAADVVAEMRSVDLLVHVVRCFDHPFSGEAGTPSRDDGAYRSELILADLAVLEKRLERLGKEGRKEGDAEVRALGRCIEALEEEIPLRRVELSDEELRLLRSYAPLSLKPLMTLYNLDEDGWSDAASEPLRNPAPADHPDEIALALCGLMEAEVAQLDAEEQAEYLEAYGLGEPARLQFVTTAYGLLDLISFLTIGPDECRAWPIRRGTVAQRAAGKVHSDIERGFIRAEVITYNDFVELGSEAAAKKAGKMRVEGKEYVVHDGDIIHYLFNV